MAAGKAASFSFYFAPDAAQLFSCNYTITPSTGTKLVVPLSATGLSTAGKISTTPTSLTFANQKLGSVSAVQKITITNTGTASLQLTGVTLTPPVFAMKTVTFPITINAGKNTTISVTYSPNLLQTDTGVAGLVFNNVPEQVVDLTGNAIAATGLTISSTATMPAATQNAAYQFQMNATAGTAPYNYTMKTGSTLPAGLTISSSGLISGTLASTVTVGTYTFSVQATDSATTKHTTSKAMSLSVGATTGAACNNISFDVSGTSNPLVALTDLGTGSYGGEEGGLYPSGSNVRPASHDSDGVTFAKAIQPLDSTGKPSPTGKYVMLALENRRCWMSSATAFLPIPKPIPLSIRRWFS